MSQRERTGVRDLTYSSWHRQQSVRRYLTAQQAAALAMVDIDDVEYCSACRQPLALIEVKHFRASTTTMTVTSNLGFLASVPSFGVRYYPTADGQDIERFVVVRNIGGERDHIDMSPAQYAAWLWSFRRNHDCPRVGVSA